MRKPRNHPFLNESVSRKEKAAEEMYAALKKMMSLVRTLDTNNGDDSWSHETDPDYLEAQAALDKADGKP